MDDLPKVTSMDILMLSEESSESEKEVENLTAEQNNDIKKVSLYRKKLTNGNCSSSGMKSLDNYSSISTSACHVQTRSQLLKRQLSSSIEGHCNYPIGIKSSAAAAAAADDDDINKRTITAPNGSMTCHQPRKRYDMVPKKVQPSKTTGLRNPKRTQNRRYYFRTGNSSMNMRPKEISALKTDPTCFIRAYINDEIQYGVFTTCTFNMNEVLLEYKGAVVKRTEGQERHGYYGDNGIGCYIMDFIHNGQKLCIDATETEGLGRYVNDAPLRFANCEMKKYVLAGTPHLFLVAIRKIEMFEELRYDYGDAKNMPWRGIPGSEKPFHLSDVTCGFWRDNGNG